MMTATETAPPPVAGLLERAQESITFQTERADRLEAELSALADRLGAVVAAAGADQRERAEQAEALMEKAREVTGAFLAGYGDSGLPMFQVAQDLARSVARILGPQDGGGPLAELRARAAAAEAEVARLEERERARAGKLLTVGEVCAMFRVSDKTVTRWSDAGKLTAVRTAGGHRRFRAAEVEELLRAGESGGSRA